jgi:2-polyprenyl-3-methyl-5-hydroxy-6-metoxy-1,4-benzoquinol methylase
MLSQFEAQKLVLLEAGCGVGNCIFPLLEEDLNIFVYACDFSPRAVEFVKVRRCTTDDPEPVGLLTKQH